MTVLARWSALPLNHRLATLALLLGFLSLFANPYPGDVVAVGVKDLASLIEQEKDHVLVGDLTAWIVEGRTDYRLIDLRGEREFAEYHIPTAENLALSSLPEAGLSPTGRIVLYSDGGVHAYQAWMLMRAKGYRNIYTLKGGLDQWKEEVLFPSLAEDAPAPERARFERMAALSRFFGGTPRTGGVQATAMKAPEMPKVEAPTAPAGVAPAKSRKKKEGC
jgi:rhodanese-related sulfurtransferase